MPSSAEATAWQAVSLAEVNDYGALNKLLSRTPAAWKSEVFYEVLHVPSPSRACLDVLFRHGLTTSTPLGDLAAPPLVVCSTVNNLEVVRYLVEQRKANLEGRDEEGRTALMEASRTGNTDVVRYLLDRRADIHAANCDGDQAVDFAAMWGRMDTLALLLERGADINAVNEWERTPLYSAAQFGNIDTVRLLLDRGASEGPSPSICAAASGGHTSIIDLLLSRGRDINAKAPYGWTALDWAIGKGRTETVSFLLDRGATFRSHHGQECVPVHDAASDGHTAVLCLLLDRGLPVLSIRSNHGFFCLHYAAQGNHVETLRFLLDRGMEVDVRAYNGSTPLHQAIFFGAIESVRLLLKRGASLEVYGKVWENKRTAVTPLLVAAACSKFPTDDVDPARHLAIFELLLDHIDRSEDPRRLLLMPCSDGRTVKSFVAKDSPASASLETRLLPHIPALKPHEDAFTLSFELLLLDAFDYVSFTSVLDVLPARKAASLSHSDWSSELLHLLNLFPSGLRPFECEPDAVYVEALASLIKDLRHRLHSLLPSQCGRDWTVNRLAWFKAGRVVQRRMEAALKRATGHTSWRGTGLGGEQ